MKHLIEAAYRGAELAYQAGLGLQMVEAFEDYVIGYVEQGDGELVGLLIETCRDIVVEPQAMSQLPQVVQAAIWKAWGILETAALMSSLWEDGLIEAAYRLMRESHQAEPEDSEEFHELLNT